jgi:uncharacterized protein (UPF0332 family)
VARSDRTRPATKADSRVFLIKAEEFLATSEDRLSAQAWDAAGLTAIHAGISGADAVLAYASGVRSASNDHRAVVELLELSVGATAKEPARHLKRLVDKKNLVAYEQRRLTQSEAAELVEHARRFVKWARSQVPEAQSAAELRGFLRGLDASGERDEDDRPL